MSTLHAFSPATVWSRTVCLSLYVLGLVAAPALADGDAGFPMPAGGQYVEECGSCHTAYAPGLLPARSWRRVMAGLAEHFGSDASLAPAERQAIEAQLLALAADTGQGNGLMTRIARGIPQGEAPLRISTSPFFKYMHDEVPGYIWKRPTIGSPANCGGCHGRANEGRYFEREIRIPK